MVATSKIGMFFTLLMCMCEQPTQGYNGIFNMFKSSNSTPSSSDLIIYPKNEQKYFIEFLKKINEGHRIINDMCETLDEKYSIISGSNKPSCNYNVSYIDNNDISVFYVNENIKTFFLKEKSNFCGVESIECGELTIMIKLIDLINYGVKISLLNLDYNTLIVNLNIIDFDSLFSLYKSSLYNEEIILNITLSKQKANVILTKEKNRIYSELNQASLSRLSDNINTWVGGPIKNIFIYTGNTISGTIESLIPTLSLDAKIIIILAVAVVIVIKSKC